MSSHDRQVYHLEVGKPGILSGTCVAAYVGKNPQSRPSGKGVCLMITLDAGNVLLKPTQKKQILARLKRAIRLGDRIGDFVLKIKMRRNGRNVEMTASVHDRFGDFSLRTKGQNWTDALRTIVRDVFREMHNHTLRNTARVNA